MGIARWRERCQGRGRNLLNKEGIVKGITGG